MTMIKAEEERSEIHYPAEEKRVVKQIADKIVYTPHTIVQCKDVEVRDYQQTERIVEDIIEVPLTIIQEEIIPQFVEYVVDVEKRVNVPVLQKRLIPRAVKQIEEEVVVRPQMEYHHDIVERTIRDIRKKPVYVDTVVQQHVVLLREVEEIVEDVIEVPCVEYVDDIVYRIAPQRHVQPAPGNPSSMAFSGQSLTGGYTHQMGGYTQQQTGGYTHQPQTRGYVLQQTGGYTQQPQTRGYVLQQTGGYAQETGGYTPQLQTRGYVQYTGGYAQQPQTGSYTQQQTSDYSQQPQTDGYAQQQTGGYSQQSTGGYTQQQTSDYSQQPQTDGYAQQSTGGYSPQSTGGYTQQPTGDYSQQPQTDGYAQQQTGGYSQQSTGANSQQPQIDGYAQQQTGGYSQQSTGGYTQQQTSDYKPQQMGIRTEREERTVRFPPGATQAVNPSPRDPAQSHLQPPHVPPFRVTSPPMETVSQLTPRLTLRRQSLQRPLLFLTPPRRSRHEGPDSRPTQHGVPKSLQPPPPLRILESIQPLQLLGRKSYAEQSPDARRRTTYGEEAWDWYDHGQSSEGPWCGLPLGMKPPAKPPATAQHSAGRWRKSDVPDTHWETAVGWWASLFAGNIGQSAEEKREIVRQVRKSIIEPVASVPSTNWAINSAQRGVSDKSNSFPRTETPDMRGPGLRNLNLSVANSGYMDSQLSHAQSAARGNQHSQPKPGQQFTPEEQLQLQYLDALEQQLERDCVSNGAQQLQEYPRSQTPPTQYSGMRQPSMQRYGAARAPHATQQNMVTQPGITPLDHSVRGNQ